MKKIGIIAAMQLEIDEFLNKCDSYEKQSIAQTDFYITNYHGHDVVAALSGIGKVYASLTTALLIENFNVDCIINIGTAGGLLMDENVLDVVVADEIIQYDLDVREWGFGHGNTHTTLKPDANLLSIVKTSIEKNKEHKVWVGPIATGDVFVYLDSHVNTIFSRYPNSIAAEMESAAVGFTCDRFNVPYAIIRSLSDITIKEGSEMDFNTYASQAAHNSAVWTCDIIDQLD